MNIQTEIQEVEAQIKKVAAERDSHLNMRTRLLRICQEQWTPAALLDTSAITPKMAFRDQSYVNQMLQTSTAKLIELNERLKHLQGLAPHERMDGEACA